MIEDTLIYDIKDLGRKYKAVLGPHGNVSSGVLEAGRMGWS